MQAVFVMVRILLPILVAGAIVVFVVKRLDEKTKRSALPKKSSKNAQVLLDSMIPLGMLAGSLVGLAVSSMTSVPLGLAFSMGAAAGLLGGYFAYEGYGAKEEN